MKTYIINDLRKSCFADPKEVRAKSPLEAVKKIYPTAKRVSEGGNIVVRCRNGRGSWVYTEELTK
nr:MAG TPA: hypothetical protein [Caudoviricetes sp.]